MEDEVAKVVETGGCARAEIVSRDEEDMTRFRDL